MRRIAAFIAVLFCANSAFAIDGSVSFDPVAAEMARRNPTNISSIYSNGKNIAVTMPSLKDGKTPEDYIIPYSISLVGSGKDPNYALILLRVKKANGVSLTKEEEEKLAPILVEERKFEERWKAEQAKQLTNAQASSDNFSLYHEMSVSSGEGKSKIRLDMKDGSIKTVEVPYYQLANDVETFCMRHSEQAVCSGASKANELSHKVTDILLRQAMGKSITAEESALITELAADSKIYDANEKLVRPICTVPNSKGQTISTSFMPACSDLSEADIASASYVGLSDDAKPMFSIAGEPTKYRFKIPDEQRQKLKREDLDLVMKWVKKS